MGAERLLSQIANGNTSDIGLSDDDKDEEGHTSQLVSVELVWLVFSFGIQCLPYFMFSCFCTGLRSWISKHIIHVFF